MSTLSASFVSASTSGPVSNRRRAARVAPAAALRAALLLGCLAAALAAAGLGDPAPLVQADTQLAFLLRGMAMIKGAMVLAALALFGWRFGHPTPAGTAAVYVGGAAVLAGASVLIWQLSFIPLAALAFHGAALVLGVAAWRDDGAPFKVRSGRHAPASSRAWEDRR